MKTTTETFEQDLERTFWALRAACTDLFAAVGVDITNPRQGARELGINKNLTWKISRLVQAEGPRESLIHIPGPAGLEILLAAAAKAGAPRAAIAGVRTAVDGFDEMVKVHCGDRGTLDLILDSMGAAEGRGGGLEKSRKLAFQGNSGIWGLQTQVQLTSFIVAPSADGENVDVAVIGGMLGFRRLRPDATWPLFRHFNQNDDGSAVEDVLIEAIDESPEARRVYLMPEFCEGPVPEIRATQEGNATRYDFAPGEIGNAGSFSFVTAHISRGAGARRRSESSRAHELHAALRLPIKTLLMDVFFHKDLEFMRDGHVFVHGRLRGESVSPSERRDSEHLPVTEDLHSIGEGPPAPSTPLFPRYRELIGTVFERAQWDQSEFAGRRVLMKYPPIPSSAIFQAELPPEIPAQDLREPA